MILYIANGIGFNECTRNYVLPKIVQQLQHLGFTCIEPFVDNNEASLSSGGRSIEKEYDIARRDVNGVRVCDGIFCVISNPIPDEGAMIELGLAMAWKKPIFLLNDDFRMTPGGNGYPMNLMLFASMPPDQWQKYYFTSLDQLSDDKKGLIQYRDRHMLANAFLRLCFLLRRRRPSSCSSAFCAHGAYWDPTDPMG